MGFDESKRAYFLRLLGPEATAGLEAGLAFQTRRLEDAGVSWADLDSCIGAACAGAAANGQAAAPAPAPAAAAAAVAALQRTIREVKAELGEIDARERAADAAAAAAAPIMPYVAMFAAPPAVAVADLRDPAGVYVADLAARGAVQS